MLTIECTGRQVRVFYTVLLVVSLFFILVNCPLFPPVSSLITTQHSRLIPLFIQGQLDLRMEGVVATWYSSIVLFTAGLAALLNCRTGPDIGWLMWLSRTGWLLIAFVLVGLSADEVAQVHESLAALLNSSDGVQLRVGAGDWIPILLPLITFVAIFMILFFFVVVRKSKLSMALALLGIICWVGAIFSEALEAGFWASDITHVMRGFIEESFELLGTTSLLIAFLEFNLRERPSAERSPLAESRGLSGAKDDALQSQPAPADMPVELSPGGSAQTDLDPVNSRSEF